MAFGSFVKLGGKLQNINIVNVEFVNICKCKLIFLMMKFK